MSNRKDREILLSYEGQVKDIRVQLFDQLKCLDDRKEQQAAIVGELQDYFRRRADVELEYSKSLERLSKNLAQKQKADKQRREQWPLCSVFSLYQSLVQVTKKQSRDHAVLGELYATNIVNRLAQAGDDLQRVYRRCRDIGVESHEELFKVHNELHTALKTYYLCLTECRQSEAKYRTAEDSRLKFKSTLSEEKQPRSRKLRVWTKEAAKKQEKYNEAKIKLLKARNEYLLSLNSANAALHKYFAEDLPELMDCMDFGLHRSVNSALKIHQLAQEKMEARARMYEQDVKLCLDNFDSRADKQKFIEANHTAFMLPRKFDFNSQIGDEVKDVSNDPAVQDELLQRFLNLSQRINGLRTENDEIWKTLDTAERTLIGMIDLVDCDVDGLFSPGGSGTLSDEKRLGDPHSNSNGSPAPSTPTSRVPETAVIKKKADKAETEQFYLSKFQEYTINSNLMTRLQAKQKLLQHALGNEIVNGRNGNAVTRHQTMPPKPRRRRIAQLGSASQRPKLFGGSLEEYIEATGQEIPTVIKSCIRVIRQFGLHHQGIFRVSGSQVEINNFRDAFERGEDPLADVVDGRDINSIAGVFKLYLRELREPLFPLYMFDQLMEVSKIEEKEEFVKQIREQLMSLPRPVFIVLRYLIAFLNHLSDYSDENMMDRFNLAICFGPTLLPIPESRDQVQYQQRVNVLIKNIFQYQDDIFPTNFGIVYEKYDIEAADITETDVLEITENFSEDETEQLTSTDDDGDYYEATAIFDFTARTPAELTMRKGDNLLLTLQIGPEWWRARQLKGSQAEGLIPDKYVEIKRRVSKSELSHVPNGGSERLQTSVTESLGSATSSTTTSTTSSSDDPFTANTISTLDLSRRTSVSKAPGSSGPDSSKSDEDSEAHKWKIPAELLIITEKTPREELEDRRRRNLISTPTNSRFSPEVFPLQTTQMPPSPRSQHQSSPHARKDVPRYYFGGGASPTAQSARTNQFFADLKHQKRAASVGHNEELVDAPDLVLNLPVKSGSPSYSAGTPVSLSDASPEATAAERFARSNQGTMKKSEIKTTSAVAPAPSSPNIGNFTLKTYEERKPVSYERAYSDQTSSIDELLESLKLVATPSISAGNSDFRPAVAPKPKIKPQSLTQKSSGGGDNGVHQAARDTYKPTSC